MSERNKFYIMRGKGFHLPLPNGYTVSVQFGPANYCDHYNRAIGRDEEKCGAEGSEQVECAVLGPDGELIDLKDFTKDEYSDSVVGYIKAPEVLRLINWAAAFVPSGGPQQ